jgi:uncharacterized protein (TIGR03435 family)
MPGRIRLIVSAWMLTAAAVVAQQDVPRFEAVSIKPSAPDAPGGQARLRPGGRYELTNGPVRILISAAYPSQMNELVGAPDWVLYDRYNVTAVAGRDVSEEELRTMMRAMLAERFRLLVRYDMVDRPVYALVLARDDGRLGPRMRRATVNCDSVPVQPPPPTGPVPPCTARFTKGSIIASGFSMEALAVNLARAAGRTVVDRTGLTDSFDFSLEYAPDPVAADAGDVPSVFTALEEQLGLKLQPSRAAVPVVVIDRIERPTPD